MSCFMNRTLLVATLVTGLLATGSLATAGPLDNSQVAAGAKWVIHFDAEAMRDSGIGKLMRAKFLSHEHVKKKMASAVEKLGMDPSEDLIDVTLYNNDFQKERGVLMVEVAKIDGEKALTHLRRRHPEVRMSTYEGHKLFTWKMRHSKGGQDYVTSTLVDGKTIVLSSELPKVMEAIDVISGKLPGLSASSPLATEAPNGTIVLMRGTDMAGADLPGKCPVLKQSHAFSFVAGQDGEKLFADTMLDMESEEAAGNVAAVINGFSALGALKFSGDKEMMALMAGLKTNVDGKIVTIDWHGKSSDTIKAVMKMKKKFRDKHGMGNHWKGHHGKHGWWKKHHGDHKKGHDKDKKE